MSQQDWQNDDDPYDCFNHLANVAFYEVLTALPDRWAMAPGWPNGLANLVDRVALRSAAETPGSSVDQAAFFEHFALPSDWSLVAGEGDGPFQGYLLEGMTR